MSQDKLYQDSLTRRKVIQLAGMTAVATVASHSPALGQGPEAGQAKSAGNAKTVSNSVFLSCMPAGTDGAGKYHTGDSTIVFPLVALWLVMLTEEWDTCLTDSTWFTNLVNELVAANGHLTPAEVTAFKAGAAQLLSQLNANPTMTKQWHSVRSIFNSLVRNASAAYGKRPCPGGGTILDIAALQPKPRP
jgi:hypothetical protein